MLEVDIVLLLTLVSLLVGLGALFRLLVINPIDKKLDQLEKNIINQVQHVYFAENSKRMDFIEQEYNRRLREIEFRNTVHDRTTMIWAEALYVSLKTQDIDIPNPQKYNWTGEKLQFDDPSTD